MYRRQVVSSVYSQDSRLSRVDQGKRSHIPRRSSKSNSIDRLSGVRPLEFEPSSAARGAQFRNRSADSSKLSSAFLKQRAESVQRSSSIKRYSRPNSIAYRETPDNKYSSYLQTPQSNKSLNNKQGYITPSNEWLRPLLNFLDHLREDRHLIKDKRPINDENWQKQTFNRLLSIIKEDLNVIAIIPTALALRQINIQSFVHLTNYVLEQFGGNKYQVNNFTYIEKLPKIARTLGYPGALNKSWLMTVGAKHSIHHVMAFLSYLFDFLAAANEMNCNLNLNTLYGDGPLILWHNYYLQSWAVYQVFEDDAIQDEYNAISDGYINELEGIYNLDDYDKIKNELTELEIMEKGLAKESEKDRQHEEKLLTESSSLKRKINNANEQYKDYENTILKTREDMKHDIMHRKEAKHLNKEIQDQIQELRLKLHEQKINSSEKNSILKEIEQSNEIVISREEILEQLKKINFERDISLACEQKKARDDSLIFNKTMLNIELAIGHPLNCYSIMERDLLSPSIIMEKNKELKKLLAQAKVSVAEQKDSSTLEYQELKMQIDSLKLSTQEKSKALECLKNKGNLIYNKNNITKQMIQDVISKERNNKLRVEWENRMNDAKKQLILTETAEKEWRAQLNTLISQEPLVHEMCQKRAERIIEVHLSIAEGAINEAVKKIKSL